MEKATLIPTNILPFVMKSEQSKWEAMLLDGMLTPAINNRLKTVDQWLEISGPDQFLAAMREGMNGPAALYLHDFKTDTDYAISGLCQNFNGSGKMYAYGLTWNVAQATMSADDKSTQPVVEAVLGVIDIDAVLSGGYTNIMLDQPYSLRGVVEHRSISHVVKNPVEWLIATAFVDGPLQFVRGDYGAMYPDEYGFMIPKNLSSLVSTDAESDEANMGCRQIQWMNNNQRETMNVHDLRDIKSEDNRFGGVGVYDVTMDGPYHASAMLAYDDFMRNLNNDHQIITQNDIEADKARKNDFPTFVFRAENKPYQYGFVEKIIPKSSQNQVSAVIRWMDGRIGRDQVGLEYLVKPKRTPDGEIVTAIQPENSENIHILSIFDESYADICDGYNDFQADANKLHLVIDLDERGSFRAHVEDYDGRCVYTLTSESESDESGMIEDGEIWEVTAGYMKHPRDINGLLSYLQEMKIARDAASMTMGNG